MKKIAFIVFLAGILLIVSSVYVVSHINYNEVKDKNEALVKKIEKINDENKNEEKKKVALNNELTKLQENLKVEINEYNLWVNLKEKLNSALSSW